jgi:hypothetical protein
MGVVYAEIELINSVDVENAKCYRIGQEEIRRMSAASGCWFAGWSGGLLFGLEDLEFAFGLYDGPAVVAFVDIGCFAVGVEFDAGDFLVLDEELGEMVSFLRQTWAGIRSISLVPSL